MWEIERTEHWANLSGGSGSESFSLGARDLPDLPKADDIQRTMNDVLDGSGFKVKSLDLTMRRFGVIMGDLIWTKPKPKTEPEAESKPEPERVLDVFHSDSFTMMWIPGTVEENRKRSKLWNQNYNG